MSSSTMRGSYLILVLLIASEIRNVCSPFPGSGNFELERWTNGNLSPQSPSGLSNNPCDTTTDTRGAQGAQLACHKECMTLKKEVRTIHSNFPDHKTSQYLHNKCGMVTEGKCSIATSLPICWCQTVTQSKDQWRNTLSNCRGGAQVVRKFTDAITSTTTATNNVLAKGAKMKANRYEMGWPAAVEAVHMQQGPPPTRPPSGDIPKRRRSDRPRRVNTGFIASCCGLGGGRPKTPEDDEPTPLLPPPPPLPQSKGKEKGETSSSRRSASPGVEEEREGKVLFATVKVGEKMLNAMIDTGAAFCIFHPDIVATAGSNVVPTTFQIYSIGAEYSYDVLGKASVRMGVSPRVTVLVTGYVAARHFNIILGTDFFVAYAAKIRISEKKMEIISGPTTVNMNVGLFTASETGMMNLNSGGYTVLWISAHVNGAATKVCIDTGSGLTVVTRNAVQQQTLYPAEAEVSYGGADCVKFLGRAKVNLMIGSNSLTVTAYVPNFVPHVDLLTGNDFNEQYVELIDYESREVTIRFPSPVGFTRVKTHALILEGE